MKLVMTYTIGDDCTWSATEVLPFEYESAEAALVDFDAALDKTNTENFTFVVAGHYFERGDFFYWSDSLHKAVKNLPTIQTLEEWFENKKGKN